MARTENAPVPKPANQAHRQDSDDEDESAGKTACLAGGGFIVGCATVVAVGKVMGFEKGGNGNGNTGIADIITELKKLQTDALSKFGGAAAGKFNEPVALTDVGKRTPIVKAVTEIKDPEEIKKLLEEASKVIVARNLAAAEVKVEAARLADLVKDGVFTDWKGTDDLLDVAKLPSLIKKELVVKGTELDVAHGGKVSDLPTNMAGTKLTDAGIQVYTTKMKDLGEQQKATKELKDVLAKLGANFA